MKLIDGIILVEEVFKFSKMAMTIMTVLLIISLVVAYYGIKKQKIFSALLAEIVAVLILVVITIDPLSLKVPTGEYKVVVTREANIKEFQEEYVVVDYSDGLYTIREREEE